MDSSDKCHKCQDAVLLPQVSLVSLRSITFVLEDKLLVPTSSRNDRKSLFSLMLTLSIGLSFCLELHLVGWFVGLSSPLDTISFSNLKFCQILKLRNWPNGWWNRPKSRDRVPVDPDMETMVAERKRNGGAGRLTESSYFTRG